MLSNEQTRKLSHYRLDISKTSDSSVTVRRLDRKITHGLSTFGCVEDSGLFAAIIKDGNKVVSIPVTSDGVTLMCNDGIAWKEKEEMPDEEILQHVKNAVDLYWKDKASNNNSDPTQ